MDKERPIEKLLRRYAKKRRDDAGAPLELHPATRRLLQGEVARQFPKADGGRNNSFAEWFAAFRRRWVYATAAIGVVLIAGVVLVVQDKDPQLDAKRHELDLAKNEIGPAKVTGKDVALKEREAGVARRLATPTPDAAPVPELSLNQPTRATPTQRDRDGLKSAEPGALAFNSDTERLRVLNDESATASPSALPRDTGQVAPAPRAIAKKAPQPIATPEEYASAARADNLSSQRLAGKPVTPPPAATVAGESQPAGAAGPGRIGRFADSSVGRDSKLTANTTDTPPALADNTVAFESREGFAPNARGGEREKALAVSQSFANLAPVSRTEKALKAPPVSPVLANFQMEQAGDQLRVIDSDGSIYLGEINPAPVTFGGGGKNQQVFKSEGKLAAPPVAAAPAPAQQSAQSYFYRVAGTNRTLNQQVVFSWNFVTLTNALAQSKTKGVGGVLNQDGSSGSQQLPALLQNSAINGRAQINAAREIEINAVPVTP
jgi:hypothetical protein